MRAFAIAAIAGLGLAALSGPVMAQPWADPEGRIVLDVPSPYREQADARQGGEFTYAEFFTPNRDCSVISMPTAGLASIDAARALDVVREDERFTEQYLLSVANSFSLIFPNDSAVLVGQSLDTSGYWPIRRVEYRAGEKAVHGAIQWRPGLQLWAMCSKYEGADAASDYDALFRSIGHPNDATWRAEAEAAAAAAPAAPAAE